MRKINALAFGLVFATSGLAMAQVTETRTVTTYPDGTRRVGQIIGSNIRLQDGTNYGRVEDVVLDDDGSIDYVVVSREGQYGLLPWSAARVDYGQRVVTYDVTPQAVQPFFFAPNAWPNYSAPEYRTRVRNVFPRAARREIRRIEREGGAVVTPPGTVVVPAPR
jgi:sporulation protein YlmC with PRC-barrel domain